MIDINVPILTSGWLGTGTVIVESFARFCITTWLPRCRTSRNPCSARMAHTSRPESTRSLPNLDLKTRHEYFRVLPSLDLGRIRCLEKQLDSFQQICPSRFNSVALARNIEFRTKSNVSASFTLNDCRNLSHPFHSLHPPASPSKRLIAQPCRLKPAVRTAKPASGWA